MLLLELLPGSPVPRVIVVVSVSPGRKQTSFVFPITTTTSMHVGPVDPVNVFEAVNEVSRKLSPVKIFPELLTITNSLMQTPIFIQPFYYTPAVKLVSSGGVNSVPCGAAGGVNFPFKNVATLDPPAPLNTFVAKNGERS